MMELSGHLRPLNHVLSADLLALVGRESFGRKCLYGLVQSKNFLVLAAQAAD